MHCLLMNLILESIKSSTDLVLISLFTNLKECIVFCSQEAYIYIITIDTISSISI